jgi:hypothetical protein
MPDLSSLVNMFQPTEADARDRGPMHPYPIDKKKAFIDGYKITPKPRLTISIPPEQLQYYRQELSKILQQSKKDWSDLTQEEAIDQSAQEGEFVKARVSNLRRRLGVDPWPRGNRILNGKFD